MYYSYVEIKYVATSFSPARTDLALKLLRCLPTTNSVSRDPIPYSESESLEES
jgi:hypothetical protein